MLPFDINTWPGVHRVETRRYFASLKGLTVSFDEFLAGYKALGLVRTGPSKARNVYRFLVKAGFINNPQEAR